MRKFEYAMPRSVDEVFQYLENNAAVKAGGIDLLDRMKEYEISPGRLVNINGIEALRYIKNGNGLRLGPSVTLAELAASKKLTGAWRVIALAAAGAATPQIRNIATLAGNLCQRPRCWYFRSADFHCTRKGGDTCFALDGENQYHAIIGNSDGCVIVHPSAMATALLALDAVIVIENGKDSRTVALADFYMTPAQDIQRETVLQADELITEISVPGTMQGWKSHYNKLKEKQAFDWPLAEVAVALQMDGKRVKDVRVVLGAAAPVPMRSELAEMVLKNSVLTHELARTAAGEAMENAEPLSENGYKVRIFKTMIYRTLCHAAGMDPFAGGV